jgi:hypothetical protein
MFWQRYDRQKRSDEWRVMSDEKARSCYAARLITGHSSLITFFYG